MIFNDKSDLILVETQNLARIESVEELQCQHEVMGGTIEMVIMPEKTYAKQLQKFNDSESYLKRLALNEEFTSKLRIEESKTKNATMTVMEKFQDLWDERDANYYERLQTRKELALQEYSIIQKAI